jgi:hypothetical protein
MKASLDKDQKEESVIKKLIKESFEKASEMNMKKASKFDTEASKWVSGLLGRIGSGRSLFYDYIKVMKI